MRQYRLLQHTTSDQLFPIVGGRLEVEAGQLGRIVAEMTGGDCRLEVYEEDPDGVYMFGVDNPRYLIYPIQRIRLQVDALFQQMTIYRPPPT